MNGFLVLARCPCDDVPIALLASLDEAKTIARSTDFDTVQQLLGPLDFGDVSELIDCIVIRFSLLGPRTVYRRNDEPSLKMVE